MQKCVVHQIRNSTKFVNYKDLKPFCADMKEIYTAPNEEAGLAALDRFEEKWNGKYSYAIGNQKNYLYHKHHRELQQEDKKSYKEQVFVPNG